MSIIKIPSRSIVGEPKLNIANDNNYNSVSYSTKDTSYDKYVKLWERELNILDLSALQSSEGTVYWSPPFSVDHQPNYLGTDTGGSDLKFYRYKYGTELSNNLKLFIPNNANNYHYFLIKVTVPKPDKNIDYSKLKFRYMDDSTSNRPIAGWKGVEYDSARLKDFVEGDFTRSISEDDIFDETTTESQMLHHFVNSDFSQTITYNTQDAFVQLRITEDNLEFYVNGCAIIGTPSTSNNGGSIAMIYTRTLAFYYVDIQTKDKDKINENAKYSLPDNELITNQTTYNGKSIYNKIENSIVDEYDSGKFSVELNCLYMIYEGINGIDNVVYTGYDGKMVSVGDIIVPYYYNGLILQGYYSELCNSPVATYKNGLPMCFKVYKSEISTQDSKYITNSVSAIEMPMSMFYTINITANRDDVTKEVRLNGVYIKESAVVYKDDINTILIPATNGNHGYWTYVRVNGVSYTLEKNLIFQVTSNMDIYFHSNYSINIQ